MTSTFTFSSIYHVELRSHTFERNYLKDQAASDCADQEIGGGIRGAVINKGSAFIYFAEILSAK